MGYGSVDISLRPDTICLVGPASEHLLSCCRPPPPDPFRMRWDEYYYNVPQIRAVGLSSHGAYALRRDGSLLGWGDIALSLDYRDQQ